MTESRRWVASSLHTDSALFLGQHRNRMRLLPMEWWEDRKSLTQSRQSFDNPLTSCFRFLLSTSCTESSRAFAWTEGRSLNGPSHSSIQPCPWDGGENESDHATPGSCFNTRHSSSLNDPVPQFGTCRSSVPGTVSHDHDHRFDGAV